MPEYEAPAVCNRISNVQCSRVMHPFQNCAKIVPKLLFTFKQNWELDENQAVCCPAILDGTIQTQSSTSRLRMQTFALSVQSGCTTVSLTSIYVLVIDYVDG
jgi:hypothetical protein